MQQGYTLFATHGPDDLARVVHYVLIDHREIAAPSESDEDQDEEEAIEDDGDDLEDDRRDEIESGQ
jgi:hypothetical protein